MDFVTLSQQLSHQSFTLLTCLSGIGLAITVRRRYPVVWIRVVLALFFEIGVETFSALWYSLYQLIVSERSWLTNSQFDDMTYLLNLGFAFTLVLLIWAAFSSRHRFG